MISKEDYFNELTDRLTRTLSHGTILGRQQNHYLKFTLAIWSRYVHRELIQDMCENGLVGDEYQVPLHERRQLDEENRELIELIESLGQVEDL